MSMSEDSFLRRQAVRMDVGSSMVDETMPSVCAPVEERARRADEYEVATALLELSAVSTTENRSGKDNAGNSKNDSGVGSKGSRESTIDVHTGEDTDMTDAPPTSQSSCPSPSPLPIARFTPINDYLKPVSASPSAPAQASPTHGQSAMTSSPAPEQASHTSTGPIYTSIREDAEREVAAEKAFRNAKIKAFHELRDKPDYNDKILKYFRDHFPNDYCMERRNAGAPKLFTCSCELVLPDEGPCDTAQEYGGVEFKRASVSHFFGHNKNNWKQIPPQYTIGQCRKHYQTISHHSRKHDDHALTVAEIFTTEAPSSSAATITDATTASNDTAPESEAAASASTKPQQKKATKKKRKTAETKPKRTPLPPYPVLQIILINAQLGKLRDWRGDDGVFDIQPTNDIQNRLNEYRRLVSEGMSQSDAATTVDKMVFSKGGKPKAVQKDTGKGKDKKDKATPGQQSPILPFLALYTLHGGDGKTIDEVFAAVAYLEAAVKAGRMAYLPAVQFLPEVRDEDMEIRKERVKIVKEGRKEFEELPKELELKNKGKKGDDGGDEVEESDVGDVALEEEEEDGGAESEGEEKEDGQVSVSGDEHQNGMAGEHSDEWETIDDEEDDFETQAKMLEMEPVRLVLKRKRLDAEASDEAKKAKAD